ncbi:cytidylyltransferase domain-containing protein [Campylobacter jejuni]|uniref:cytidylyltransferase domain-containing protein n=1 Tax=Campylobacter jejuni TaxID=197 RepID=UPI0024BE353E|nr:hypothetical protein [Campylobacter jejuni]
MFSAIIPIRKKDKQLEIFECNDFSLLERKIRDFKKIDLIDEIIVASDSLEIKEQVENFDVKFYLRKEEEVQDNLEFFIKNLVLNIKNQYVIWTSCFNPFINEKIFSEAIDEFLNLDFNIYDSLITCARLDKFILDENGPLNFKTGHYHIHSSNLSKLYYLVNGCFIISKTLMQKYKYHWGKVPYKKILNRDSVFEIKNEEDFLFFKQVLDRKGK